MADSKHYVIQGGLEGRERLRILARVMHTSSMSLLDRLDLRDGMCCLDVGCGGGDVTLDVARRVAPNGKAVGIDIDETKLAIARSEAEQASISNVEYRLLDVRQALVSNPFDVVYARFLLTHLSDPADTVRIFYRHLRPGGRLGVEDIDFSGHFTYPASKAFERYCELYCAIVVRRGGDPNIGPRLPGLLKEGGLKDVEMTVAQPIGMEGEVKLVNALTMENIAAAVLADGLATQEEIDDVVRELYEFAANPNTVAGLPRIVQTWGRRPRDEM